MLVVLAMSSSQRLFAGCYAASGAAALVYQVVWARLLAQQMGHASASVGTVLAAFMGGLAAGAWVGGRLSGGTGQDDQAWRLSAYAVLEISIALAAIALPELLAMLFPVLVWAYSDGTAPASFAIVRISIGLTLLGLPAAAMGATFPIAAAWFAGVVAPVLDTKGPGPRRNSSISRAAGDAGVLYAINTAGAACGALAAGFWLVPALGLRGTTLIGVALNVMAAAGALALKRTTARVRTGSSAVRPTRGVVRKTSPLPSVRGKSQPFDAVRARQGSRVARPALACTAATISGMVALVYEVAWTRLIALVIGPTTQAFAIMLVSFTGGIAVGSAVGARLARRVSAPAIWLAAMLAVAAGAASLAGWFAATRLPLIVAAQVADPQITFGRILVRQGVAFGLLLLPLTVALGGAFSFAVATALPSAQAVGSNAGRVYAWNTVGAIAGALLGSFMLLPLLGLQGTFRATALLGLAAATAFSLMGISDNSQRRLGLTLAALVICGSVVLVLPKWDRELLASGAYKYAAYLDASNVNAELRAGRLLYYKDGPIATVSVSELAGMRSLAIDGKVDASNSGDMLTQRLLGLLPVLLHPDPQEILVIGLGSGVTIGSALGSGKVRHADVVEISPDVVEASSFFERENGGVLATPEVRLIVGDGRSHLLLTDRRYDVIISEPSNPWMAGIAALFTREFFEVAWDRLKPGGVICQWAHTYDIRPEDLRSIVRTFASVFPHGTMWLAGDGDLLLIGLRDGGIDPYLESMVQNWPSTTPAVLQDITGPGGAAPFALMSLYAGGPAEMRRYAGNATIQHDDRMALEFTAPYGLYGRTMEANAAIIRALADATAVPPAVRDAFALATDQHWVAAGRMALSARAFDPAYDAFRRAVTLNSRNGDALSGLSEAAAGAQRLDEVSAWLRLLAEAEPANAAVRVELSRVLAAGGDLEEAARVATAAMRAAPEDPSSGEQLASVVAEAGDADRLAALSDWLIARFPHRDRPRYYRAEALFLHGRVEQAVDEARQFVARNPRDVRAQNLLGAACASLGERACAQAAFEASLRANPRNSATYVNLGLFHLQSANPDTAAEYFAAALTLDPSSRPARQGLASARAVLSNRR